MSQPLVRYCVREDRYEGFAMGVVPDPEDPTFFVYMVTCSNEGHGTRVAGPVTRRRAQAIARAYGETEALEPPK